MGVALAQLCTAPREQRNTKETTAAAGSVMRWNYVTLGVAVALGGVGRHHDPTARRAQGVENRQGTHERVALGDLGAVTQCILKKMKHPLGSQQPSACKGDPCHRFGPSL